MVVIGVDCGVRSFTATVTEPSSGMAMKWEAAKSENRGVELNVLDSGVKAMPIALGTNEDEALIVVEAPIVAGVRNIRSSLQLAQVTGIVQAGLPNTIEVAVGQWKKEILGKGNANKEEVARWVEANHPDAYLHLKGSQDALDAFCIALYGEAVQDRLHAALSAWGGSPDQATE